MGAIIDFPGVRKRGALTVEIPLELAVAAFPSLTAQFPFVLVQDGSSDSSPPVGTGPFKFQSFAPAQQSVFVANRNYWRPGLPVLDSLVIDTSHTDEFAKVNALLSGAAHAVVNLPYEVAEQHEGQEELRILNATGPSYQYLVMRMDTEPFTMLEYAKRCV